MSGSPFENMAARRLPASDGITYRATCDFDWKARSAVVTVEGAVGPITMTVKSAVSDHKDSDGTVDEYAAALDHCRLTIIENFRRLLNVPAQA